MNARDHVENLTRRERLRRVVILCCNCTRNLAFYRGLSDQGRALLSETHPHAGFWRQAHANFIDIYVLEWCKLFADTKGHHYWRRIVTDATSFEAALLRRLGMDADGFQSEIDAMRVYRNKFVAHLNSLKVMDVPQLDAAQESVRFYHDHIVTREATPEDLTGLPGTRDTLACGYKEAMAEAHSIVSKAK